MEAPTAFALLLRRHGFSTRAVLTARLDAGGVYISPQTAGDWLRGASHPRDGIRMRVANALGIEFVELAKACAGVSEDNNEVNRG